MITQITCVLTDAFRKALLVRPRKHERRRRTVGRDGEHTRRLSAGVCRQRQLHGHRLLLEQRGRPAV